jgi:hypothetical protein
MQAQNTNIQFISTKTTPASEMIIEDHLKKCLGKTQTHPYNAYANKHVPRNLHSCFGDFPKEKMPKKAPAPEPEPLEMHIKSLAVTGNRKILNYL